MSGVALVLDGIVIVLLAVAIGFGVILSRRLTALKRSGADMQAKLAEFNEAAATAEESLAQLKAAVPEANEASNAAVADPEAMLKAEILRDDLMFLIERAENLLKKAAAAPRAAASPSIAATASVAAPRPVVPREVGGALRRAVRTGVSPQTGGETAADPAADSESAGAGAGVSRIG